MNYIFVCLYILLLVFSLYAEKRNYCEHISPLFFFTDVWCVIAIVSNLGLFDYYLPSIAVDCMMLLMIIASIISWMIINKSRRRTPLLMRDKQTELEVDIFGVAFLELIFVLIIYPDIKNSFYYLKSGVSLSLIRAFLYEEANTAGLRAQFRMLIAQPIVSTFSVLSVVSIISKIDKYKRFILWVITIANISIYTIATAGRWQIINLLTYFLIAIVLFRGDRVVRFLVNNVRYTVGILIIIGVVVFVSYQRSSTPDVLKTIYTYYFSGPSYLSRILDVNDSIFSINHDFMYGAATFGFISNFFSYALMVLTGRPRGSLYMMGSVLTNHNVQVGAHTYVNAMCTCIYNFLVDWGYVGVIIGPIIIVLITNYLYKKEMKYHSMITKCMLILFLNAMVNSGFKWGLVSLEYSMNFVFLVIINKTHRVYT